MKFHLKFLDWMIKNLWFQLIKCPWHKNTFADDLAAENAPAEENQKENAAEQNVTSPQPEMIFPWIWILTYEPLANPGALPLPENWAAQLSISPLFLQILLGRHIGNFEEINSYLAARKKTWFHHGIGP